MDVPVAENGGRSCEDTSEIDQHCGGDDQLQQTSLAEKNHSGDDSTTFTIEQQQRLKGERFHRRGLLTCSILYTFFYVGSFFGWGPMQLMVRPY